MMARQLIDGASYGPDTLKIIGEAFDEAWLTIAGNYGGSASIEAARLRLANAMLSVASEDSRDVDALKRGALEAMALNAL
jgi:hypothetical protein